MCSSLDGSHSLAITNTAAICAHGPASRPAGKSAAHSSSSRSARHSVHPSQTSPNERVRSTRSPVSRTAMVWSPVAVSSNSSCCSLPPVICCASSLARARPSPSSSPRCATVSCTTFRPCRTERTNRQYRCARPPFRTTVCRRYTPPHLALVAIATTRAPRKARRLALHPDSASARRIPLALPARCSRRIYFRMPSWGSWARPATVDRTAWREGAPRRRPPQLPRAPAAAGGRCSLRVARGARTGSRAGAPRSRERSCGALRRDDFPDRLDQLRLRHGADDLLLHLPGLEEVQVREAAHTVARRRARVVVDVHLHDLQLARELACDLLDDRCDRPTRPAPGGPEVDEHGGGAL